MPTGILTLLATRAAGSLLGVLGKEAARHLLRSGPVQKSIAATDRKFNGELEGVGDALRRWLQDEETVRCLEAMRAGDPPPSVSETLVESFVGRDWFAGAETRESAERVLEAFFDALYQNAIKDKEEGALTHDRREARWHERTWRELKEIQRLLTSVPALSGGFGTNIENFVSYYLERRDGLVPFGGRTDEISRLDRWLDDADHTPYLLLTSVAGQGKSALLVRWLQNVATRTDTALVFVPISVRFGTSLSSTFFSILASQLAAHLKTDPPAPNHSAEMWKRTAGNYLSQPLPDNRRLLVVLDGIDEAADWTPARDLFPAVPREGLRVVVSARLRVNDPQGRNWLRQLGWERYDPEKAILKLEPLAPGAVAEVFRSSAPEALRPEGEAWGRELFRLTRGDAFLVDLYITDLRSAVESGRLPRPHDLQSRTPGLEAYLKDWWDDQQALWSASAGEKSFPLDRRRVRIFFDLLACARGPLTREDLVDELTTERDGISDLDLDRHLAPLQRFVVGDGKTQGYVLAHPKLRDYFFDKLKPTQRSKWEGRFLRWGERTLDALEAGRLPPVGVPRYLTQYYGAHLADGPHADAEARARAGLRLVGDHWRAAWFALEHTYTGFLSDVDRAVALARAWGAREAGAGNVTPVLGDLLRCMLCHSSVRSLATGIPSELFPVLVDTREWSPEVAMAYIHHLPEEKFTAAITELAEVLPDVLVEQAAERAEHFQDPACVVSTFLACAPRLSDPARERLRAAAVAAVLADADPEEEAALFADLFPTLSEGVERDALLAAALDRARRIEPRFFSRIALLRLCPCVPPAEREGVIAEAAQEPFGPDEYEPDDPMKNEHGGVTFLVLLATHASGELQRDAVLEALAIEDDPLFDGLNRARALTWMASALPLPLRKRAVRNALRAARRVRTHKFRAELLAALVPLLPERAKPVLVERCIDAIRKVDSKIGRESDQTDAIRHLVPHLPPEGLPPLTALVSGFASAASQAEAFAVLASHFEGPVRSELADASLRAAWLIDDTWSRDNFVAHACATLAAVGDIPTALDRAAELPPGPLHTLALARIADRLNGPDRDAAFERALDSVDAAPAELYSQFDNISFLAARVPVAQKERVQKIVTRCIGTYDNYIATPDLVVATFPHFPDGPLKEVESYVTSRSEYDSDKPVLLAMLATRMPEPRRSALLQEAEALAGVEDSAAPPLPAMSVGTLAAMVPHLQARARRRALARALRLIEQELTGNLQASSLAKLGPVLPRRLQPHAVERACSLENWADRAIALAGLGPHLSDACVERAIGCAADAPRGWRAVTLASLLPYASESRRSAVFDAFVHATADAAAEELPWLQEFATTLPTEMRWASLPAAVSLRLNRWSLVGAFDRTMSLQRLVRALEPVADLLLFDWLGTLFSALSAQPRRDFLADATVLLPLISATGGAPAIARCITATREVGKWWP